MQEITLEHKEQIEALCKKYRNELSSHTFASLYLWQHQMGLELCLQEDFFTVKCKMQGENVWFFPCGAENAVYQFIFTKMQEPSFSLCYLRTEDAMWLEKRFPGKWTLTRDEASDEYICEISRYISMEGSHFAELRKKIRHLERTYQSEVKPLSEETVEDALTVLNKWKSITHNRGENDLTDEGIGEKAFDQRKLLGIEGSILYLNEEPAAVFAGFPIGMNVLDVLIGKCAPDAPDYTIYYAMREYLKQNGNGFVFANLEEDLGIPGIRLVKNKMRPVRKNEVWEAVLK